MNDSNQRIVFTDANGNVRWFYLNDDVQSWYAQGTINIGQGMAFLLVLSLMPNGEWIEWPDGDVDIGKHTRILSESEAADWLLSEGFDPPQNLQHILEEKGFGARSSNSSDQAQSDGLPQRNSIVMPLLWDWENSPPLTTGLTIKLTRGIVASLANFQGRISNTKVSSGSYAASDLVRISMRLAALSEVIGRLNHPIRSELRMLYPAPPQLNDRIVTSFTERALDLVSELELWARNTVMNQPDVDIDLFLSPWSDQKFERQEQVYTANSDRLIDFWSGGTPPVDLSGLGSLSAGIKWERSRVEEDDEGDSTVDRTKSAESDATVNNNGSLRRLLSVFTNGVSDDRYTEAADVLNDDKLSTNEKLTQINSIIPLPPTVSAQKLGDMIGVTKQSVLKSDWWEKNRKGEKENEIGRRRNVHRERAKQHEPKMNSSEHE